MGIAPQILHHAGGATEWRLAIDHPVLLVAGLKQALETGGIFEMLLRSVELQLHCLDVGKEFTPEQLGHHSDGQEKLLARCPPFAKVIQPTTGDDAVDMGMEGEILAPGMQDGSQAGFRVKIFLIRRQLQNGFGGTPEQKGIQRPLVLKYYRSQCRRNGEHRMEIRNIQQIICPGLHPSLSGQALAFGTVAVAAGIVRHLYITTILADLGMSAQLACPAILNGGHDLERWERHLVPSTVFRPILPEDILQLTHGVACPEGTAPAFPKWPTDANICRRWICGHGPEAA